jgi:hypothetical protein
MELLRVKSFSATRYKAAKPVGESDPALSAVDRDRVAQPH